MYDAFSVRGKKLESERACTVCTCGERSKHFIEDVMNLVLLFTYVDKCSLGFLGFVCGTASLAERLGNINHTQIPNGTACLQTLTNKNDHCACATLHLNV